MRYLLFPLLTLNVWGAWDADVYSVGSTTAILRIRGYSGACLIDLNTYDGLFNPPHPDWPSPTLDNTHSTTTEDGNGTKYIQLGQRRGNLALVAGQAYFVNVAGCGGSKTVFFNTLPAKMGAITPRPTGQNLNNYTKADVPTIDWSSTGRDKWYTDPTSGIELKMISKPEDYSWAHSTDQNWTRWAGASGWTSASTISNGATSNATTTNTNPIYLYSNIGDPWVITQRSIENIGVQLWGSCGGGAVVGTDDCKLVMYFFDTPGTPVGTPIEIAVGASYAAITSGASSFSNSPKNIVSNNTFPSNYPRPYFAGWGTGVSVPNTKRAGSAAFSTTISGTSVTASSISTTSHFPLGLDPGDHIWINGSGCSASGNTDVCTVATVTDGRQITITESLGIASGTAMPHPWGIAIYKKTAVGEIRVGAKHRLSGGPQSSTGTLQATCSSIEIIRSDGVKGHACIIPDRNSYGIVYFISNDGTYVHMIMTSNVAALGGPLSGLTFDTISPNVFYAYHTTTNNLWKFTYNGDWGVTPTVWEQDPPSGARYAVNFGGDFSYATWESPYVTAVNYISNATSKINTYAAGLSTPTNIVQTPYEAWNGRFFGISGRLAFYGRVLNPPYQDTGPCQIFVFNLDTTDIIDYLDGGTDPNNPTMFGECHSFIARADIDNTYNMGFNISGNKGGVLSTVDRLLHGPHRININAVMRGGSWDTSDTSLPWPSTTAYDRACPSVGVGANQIPQSYADVGANGNQCVTLRISGSTAAKAICNEYGNDTTSGGGDRAIYGVCEWDSSTDYSGGPTLEVGMKFVDRTYMQKPNPSPPPTFLGNQAPGDQENFRVLTIEPAGDGVNLKIVVQRNASREHCCSSTSTSSPAGRECAQGNAQLQHVHNWKGGMVYGSFGSCNSASIYMTYPNATTSAGRYFTEVPALIAAGHSGMGKGPGGTISFLGSGGDRTIATIADIGIQPTPDLRTRNSRWHGQDVDIGGLIQQYIGKHQSAAPDHFKYFGVDSNSLNPSLGQSGNNFGNGLSSGRAGDTFTQVSGRLWRVGLVGTEDIKHKPIIGWCGPRQLTDISSPATGNLIDAAPDYSMCRARNNNECRTGSTPGMMWVTCPNTTKHPTAATANIPQTGMDYLHIPVTLSIAGNAGYARTFDDSSTDVTGFKQRIVTNAFKPQGNQFPFWGVTMHPAGRLMLLPSGGWQDGIRNVYWLARVPKHPKEGPRVTGFSIPIMQYGAKTGVTHRRIKFGNNPSFQCNPNYLDECFTDGAVLPYAFENETPATPTACGSGCSLGIPAWPDEPLWYVEQEYNGSVWTDGPVKVMVP